MNIVIRPADEHDRDWIDQNSDDVGGPAVVSLGTLHRLADHPALIAWNDSGERLGFAVYRIDGPEAELIAISATEQWSGVGSALMAEVEGAVRSHSCEGLFLCTTNDNVDAVRFYQRRGYRLCDLHIGAFEEVLRLKGLDPEQEVIGKHQIVIRDELVLEKRFTA